MEQESSFSNPAWTVDAATVGRTIAEGRRTRGLTQEDLARRLGVTKAAVSKWEQMVSLPDISLLPGIASLLDLTVDELLGWNPQLSEEETILLIHELRDGFMHDALGTFDRARRIAASHWKCWQALVSIASELLRAVSGGVVEARDDVAEMRHAEANGDESAASLPTDLARTMLDECIAICEHVERDSDDAAMANLAVSTHAAAMIRRKDKPRAIIDFVEPFVKPPAPLGGKPGLASLYVLAGDRDRASELVRSSMIEAIAELSQATLIWMDEATDTKTIFECIDAFETLASTYAPVANTPHLTVLGPSARVSAAAAFAKRNAHEESLEQLECAADRLARLDVSALAGSPSFEDSPAVLASAICTPEAWGALAEEPRYQAVVAQLGELFEL